MCSLLLDALTFCRNLLRSRTALAAENLFLRKQLTFYQERQRLPAGTRRLSERRLQSGNLWFLPARPLNSRPATSVKSLHDPAQTETPFEILFVGDSITWLPLAL